MSRRILLGFGLFLLLGSVTGLIRPAYADLGTEPDIAGVTEKSGETLDLPPLKAVLIVGPIDGDYGTWTQEEKANMELAANELTANGVEVHKFYTPNNDWDEIKAAADGAEFLLYRGHGVAWGSGSTPPVGGFYLNGNNFVSSDDIRQDLDLATNALAMIYGCYAAGHSGDEDYDIGLTEACRRVAQYSDPFFDIGAAGYYSDWFGDAFQMYTRYLFQGQTLGEAYESFYDFNPNTVYRTTHPDHPGLDMWLDKDNWYGYWSYNNAFAGLSDQTLADLFSVTVIPGDLNGDGFVGSQDLDMVRAAWNTAVTPGTSGDATDDGLVNSADLDVVRSNWGSGTAAVPEPGFVVLGVMGGVLIFGRWGGTPWSGRRVPTGRTGSAGR